MGEGAEGLSHISRLSSQRVENPRDVLTEGQEVTARVLEVNPTERRIRLSLRPAHEEPAKRAPRDEQPRERFQQDDQPRRDERPRRRRPDGDRRRQENPNSQLPQEEMNFTLGDFPKNLPPIHIGPSPPRPSGPPPWPPQPPTTK